MPAVSDADFGKLDTTYGTILFTKRPEGELVHWVVRGEAPELAETIRGMEPAAISTEEARNFYMAYPENVETPLLYGSRRIDADGEGRTTFKTGWARLKGRVYKTNTRVRYRDDGGMTISLSVGWATPAKQWRWVSRTTKDKNDVMPFFARLVRMAQAEQAEFEADPEAVKADGEQRASPVQRVARRKTPYTEDRSEWEL